MNKQPVVKGCLSVKYRKYFLGKRGKKLQADKPDSVLPAMALAKAGLTLQSEASKSKGLSFICSRGYRRDSSCLPCIVPALLQNSDEPPFYDTICGISACKVYPLMMLPSKAVSSYLTFSPLPSIALATEGSHFLWHFLLAVSNQPAIHRCIALCCPDFPTLCKQRIDSLACSIGKDSYCHTKYSIHQNIRSGSA
jgi:hypothetical protein